MLKLPSVSISKDERAVFNLLAIMYWPFDRLEMLEGVCVVFWFVGLGCLLGVCVAYGLWI